MVDFEDTNLYTAGKIEIKDNNSFRDTTVSSFKNFNREFIYGYWLAFSLKSLEKINAHLKEIKVNDKLQRSALIKLREILADYSGFIIGYMRLMKTKTSYLLHFDSINSYVTSFLMSNDVSFTDGITKIMSIIGKQGELILDEVKKTSLSQKLIIHGLEKTVKKMEKKSNNFINDFKRITKKELSPSFSEKFNAWVALKRGDKSLIKGTMIESQPTFLNNKPVVNDSVDKDKLEELRKSLINDYSFVSNISSESFRLNQLIINLRGLKRDSNLEDAALSRLRDIIAHYKTFLINYISLMNTKTSNDIIIVGINHTVSSIVGLASMNTNETTDFIVHITDLYTLICAQSETIINSFKGVSKTESNAINLIDEYLNRIIKESNNFMRAYSRYTDRSGRDSFLNKLKSFLTLKLGKNDLEGTLRYNMASRPAVPRASASESERLHNILSGKSTGQSNIQKNLSERMREAITPKKLEFVKAGPVSKDWSASLAKQSTPMKWNKISKPSNVKVHAPRFKA